MFELARCPHISNDHDVNGTRRGYKGISIPTMVEAENFRGGVLEMDDPEHRHYRNALNPVSVARCDQAVGAFRR